MTEWRADAEAIRAALRTPAPPEPEMTPQREAQLRELGYELPGFTERQIAANAAAREDIWRSRMAPERDSNAA